ncbi:thioredoxin family protein [Mucisphaera sp.]|uniref:thioredoxin family protein n=1 Tax=Mucisphaera sp. TaxID=2913024 RepID=UPI003D0C7395
MDAVYLRQKHQAGLVYDDYMATGTDQQQKNWREVYDRAALTDAQQALLGDFVREIRVLALSGIWCGDCSQQMPIVQKIAEASDGKVDLRWLDRDEHADLQDKLMINAGKRVPVVVFAAEDYEPVGWFGDKTLARYRAMAANQLGPSCPMPGAAVPDSELAAVTSDWVDQFERVHLLLRLSGRLRKLHGD